MNRFYSHGFNDIRERYLPMLEAMVRTQGIISVLVLLDREYVSVAKARLIPELNLLPEILVASNPDWLSGLIRNVGFAGVLEWLADIISEAKVKGSTRDLASVALLATQLRAKSQMLLVEHLKNTELEEVN